MSAAVLRTIAMFAFGASVLAATRTSAAQCGAQRSTCAGCHDNRRAPYQASAAWHMDHAFADLCVGCHGGDGRAPEEARAHVGVALRRGQDACNACHAGDAARTAARYEARPSSAPIVREEHGRPATNVVLGALALLLGTVVVRGRRR